MEGVPLPGLVVKQLHRVTFVTQDDSKHHWSDHAPWWEAMPVLGAILEKMQSTSFQVMNHLDRIPGRAAACRHHPFTVWCARVHKWSLGEVFLWSTYVAFDLRRYEVILRRVQHTPCDDANLNVTSSMQRQGYPMWVVGAQYDLHAVPCRAFHPTAGSHEAVLFVDGLGNHRTARAH